MKSTQIAALSAGALLLLSPLAAFAHESQTFKIGDKTYTFVVGSLGEPLVIDDKSGVDLSVSQAGAPGMAAHDDDGDDDAPAGGPVEGLEKTLKVEVSAGDKKKTLDLSAVYGKAGSYKAVFIPTVQTTYTYRFMGTINNVPVDVSFVCNPAGHPQVDEDTKETPMGTNVTRTDKKGAFGCPLVKADLGFPEPAPTLVELKGGSSASGNSNVALAIAVVALVIGLGAMRKR